MPHQRYTEKRGANHGLHVFLSIITCGLWAITGWPIAAAMGRKTVTKVPTYQPPAQQGWQQPPPQGYQAPPYYGPPAGGQQPPPPPPQRPITPPGWPPRT